jgi:hypothetical protein
MQPDRAFFDRRAWANLFRSALAALAALSVSACVGYSHMAPVYEEMQTDLKTKGDVLRRFGEPLRKVRQDDRETWYYLLPRSGSTRGVQETETMAIVGIVPLWWTSKLEENAQFVFRADQLVQAMELVKRRSGFICGVIPAHGVHTGCGAVDENKK